ncbi:MAG: hypothetical protein SV760_07750 [Halobacteria archaeon]|nr:hypothetical protein [Halobacteria archaeon]
MDLDKLREVQAKEREGKSLKELDDSFYSDAAEYIQGLRDERDSLDDPFSDDAQRLNDKLQTAQEFVESIYERRVGKVVKLASLSASGVSVDESQMTREEREMYDNIVDEIDTNYDLVIGEVLDGGEASEEDVADDESQRETGTDTDMRAEETTNREDSRHDAEKTSETELSMELEEPGGDDEATSDVGRATRTDGGDDGYSTVRVTEDLPEFMGTDGREYSLTEEDVAVIPEENADALCEKEAAEKIQ